MSLPSGWAEAPLGCLLKRIETGKSFQCIERPPMEGERGIVKVSSVTSGVFREEESKTIPQQNRLEPQHRIREGDLLFSRANTIDLVGATAQVKCDPARELYLSDKIWRLRTQDGLLPWIHQYLASPTGRKKISAASSGNQLSMRNVSQASLLGLELPVPPQNEQRRIVARIEELTARSKNAKVVLQGIPPLLSRLRQSILRNAFHCSRGEVGAPAAPVCIGTPQTAAPGGWFWRPLIEMARLESGHTPRKTVEEYWQSGDVPWISLQDIRGAHGQVLKETINKPTLLGIENSSARLLPENTVCWSRDISVGFVTIMGREMATSQHFANWVCGPDLNPRFLMWALVAAREQLIRSGEGTVVSTIYMPALKQFQILVPSSLTQANVVEAIETQLRYVSRMESIPRALVGQLRKLENVVLSKAFRGELVPQDPNDEPASVLLERIRGMVPQTRTRFF